MLMIGQVFIFGCNQRTNDNADVAVDKPVAATMADTVHIDDPFSDNPFADVDWTATNEPDASHFAKAVDYQLDDLVPCSDDKAAFILEVKALTGGNCFYRREQGFQRYNDRRFDPTSEPGMTQENLVCAMLVNGFASGTFQYTDLSSESVTVRIRWKASQGDHEEEFAGEFTPRVGEFGTADAGNGNVFSWSFARKD